MKLRTKIIFITCFVLVLSLAVGITFFITAKNYTDRYQVDSWPFQTRLHVESFSANSDVQRLGMFNDKFNVRISIGGYLQSYGNGFGLRIKKVHISETFDEQENVVYVKLTPIVGENSKKVKDFNQQFEYNLNYKLHRYKSYKVNKYILQCEDLEQIIEIQ